MSHGLMLLKKEDFPNGLFDQFVEKIPERLSYDPSELKPIDANDIIKSEHL